MTARRSWVDATTAAVDRLPLPPWLVYLAASLLLAGISIVLRWADGSSPVPQAAPIPAVFAAGGPYVLGVIHYLDRAARRALVDFRPALGALEPRYGELVQRLTAMPASLALIAVPIGAVPPLIGHLGGGWGVTQSTSLLTAIFTFAVQLLLNALFVAFLLRIGRQLRGIVLIHREATAIRLSGTGAHNAFSGFTFRAAVLVTVPYALVEVLAGLLGESTVVELVLLALALAVSVAVFILPLQGMHIRLVALKQAHLTEIEFAFDRASAELISLLSAEGPSGRTSSASHALRALGVVRERVSRLSAWPWSPEALRGFVTSIAVPVALWLATPMLEGMLPG